MKSWKKNHAEGEGRESESHIHHPKSQGVTMIYCLPARPGARKERKPNGGRERMTHQKRILKLPFYSRVGEWMKPTLGQMKKKWKMTPTGVNVPRHTKMRKNGPTGANEWGRTKGSQGRCERQSSTQSRQKSNKIKWFKTKLYLYVKLSTIYRSLSSLDLQSRIHHDID